MRPLASVAYNRRQFFRFLAASPCLARAAESPVLASPKDALNVMDFEAAARKALPPAHWGYLATGVDDDLTVRANREGFGRLALRPRRLAGVATFDTHTNILGTALDHPILTAPLGSVRAFHPDGEVGVARAAKSKGAMVVLSTNTTCRIEDVNQALGRPVWYQLYATNNWQITEKLVRKAEDSGCSVFALTVDLPVGRNTETQTRLRRLDTRKCEMCHTNDRGLFYQRKPMFDGIDMKGVVSNQPGMDWDFVERLKKLTKMKLVLKGIEAGEDAALAVQHGVDGIIVSNHGGRAAESGRGTIDCLPEVVEGAAGRIPVLLDGGVRRGTDIVKALALGARAVCIGRPYAWGLSAFGQPGVERVLELLRAEFELSMRQVGARTLAEIQRSMVVRL
jgi:4-hydroxymandelate oxidase